VCVCVEKCSGCESSWASCRSASDRQPWHAMRLLHHNVPALTRLHLHFDMPPPSFCGPQPKAAAAAGAWTFGWRPSAPERAHSGPTPPPHGSRSPPGTSHGRVYAGCLTGNHWLWHGARRGRGWGGRCVGRFDTKALLVPLKEACGVRVRLWAVCCPLTRGCV
jgi:hypothetical protein